MHTNVHVHVVLSNFTHLADIRNFTIHVTNCSVYLNISLSISANIQQGDRLISQVCGWQTHPLPLKDPNDIIIVHALGVYLNSGRVNCMLNNLIVVCNGLVTNGNQSSKWEGQWVEQRGLGIDRDVLPQSTVDLFVLHGYHYRLQASTPIDIHIPYSGKL